MPVSKRGARVGAAAFVLGLSLAGPQGLVAGVASAESADSDSPAVSDSVGKASRGATASSTRRTGARPDRPATAPPAATGAPRAAVVAGLPGTGDTSKSAADLTPKSKGAHARPVFPAAAAPGASPAASAPNPVLATVLVPSAAAVTHSLASIVPAPIRPASAFAVPGVAQQTVRGKLRSASRQAALLGSPRPGVLTAAVDNFFASTTNWLSGLPASPLTNFLQGALQLVRRSIGNFIHGTSAGDTTVTTAATTPYFTDQELSDYLLALAQEQYGGLFGQTVPVVNYPIYYKTAEGAYYTMDASAPVVRGGGIVSDTNTQVNGVDEADFVETDGNYIYAAQNGQLTIFSAGSSDSPGAGTSVTSQTAIPGYVVGQYLSGDRLTVITQTGGSWDTPMMVRMAGPWYWNPQTTITVYDVADRTTPAVVTQTVFDGGYRDSRSVDGTVYLVLDRSLKLPPPRYTEFTVPPDTTIPDPTIPEPTVWDQALPEAQIVDAVVADKMMIRWDPSAPVAYRTYETWDEYVARVGPDITTLSLPHAYSVDADGNLVDLGVIAGAQDIVRPSVSGGQSLLTIVSIDAQNATAATHFSDSVGELGYSSGTTVYMTRDALYVASNQDNYSEKGSSSQTRIDRFTVAGTDLGWQASGVVPGSLINQFAMDEQGGYLHVATHTWSWQLTPSENGDTWTSQNDNGVYTLDTAGDTLDITGSLTGLAPGEQLYAARFVGDNAYLVTFVRTDPLFAIDLSDPAAPVLQGELVIPGFSNYLQPVGDGLLVGIGQEREPGTWNTRVHVSLFDVSDGSNPTQVDRQFLDESAQWSWSEAQYDHHAVLYSPEDGLMVVPLSASGYDAQTGEYRYDQTLQVLHVDAGGVEVRGVIHTDGTVLRAVRIGNVLYAVSADHVTAYSLDDLSVVSSV